MARSIGADEKKWQQEDDARILAEANTIKKDKKRLKGAIIGAKRMANEESKRLSSLRTVSKLSIRPTSKKKK